MAGVVRQLLVEVRIFRNMRHRLQQLVTHALTTLAAVRKYGVAHQDHCGPLFVKVADLVNTGVADQLSGLKGAVGLVKYGNGSWIH